MSNTSLFQSTAVALALVGAATVQADTNQPLAQKLDQQVLVMQQAVTNSSVTPLYTPSQRDKKMALIDRAKSHAQDGNYKTALNQLEQAGRLLYPMEPVSQIPLKGDKQQEWLKQMQRVIEAVMPVATEISLEKDSHQESLAAVTQTYQQGLSAWHDNDVGRAETLLTQAYSDLQQLVVGLRSGDQLYIEQPEMGTEQAWVESVRRFQDWRYFADWMQQASVEMGIDPESVLQGSLVADGLFSDAQVHAGQQRWQQASQLLDSAYLVMEEHWRRAGINI